MTLQYLPVGCSIRKKVGRTGKERVFSSSQLDLSSPSAAAAQSQPLNSRGPLGPTLVGTSSQLSPFPPLPIRVRYQYAVGGGLEGRGTMCYIDNVLTA